MRMSERKRRKDRQTRIEVLIAVALVALLYLIQWLGS